MASTGGNPKFAAAYVVLVVLPLLCLAIVLRTGRALVAPASINGAWDFTFDSEHFSAEACPAVHLSLEKSTVLVSQSGQTFSLEMRPGPLSSSHGLINGRTLTAHLQMLKTASGLVCSREFILDGYVEPARHPTSMTGTLKIRDCASCGSLRFHALKEQTAL